uniref:Ovule protein n=1 Tax=Heterorhabditis bacteriophora TaxID=37862 RepID=A0A1I7W6D1_HETBA
MLILFLPVQSNTKNYTTPTKKGHLSHTCLSLGTLLLAVKISLLKQKKPEQREKIKLHIQRGTKWFLSTYQTISVCNKNNLQETTMWK